MTPAPADGLHVNSDAPQRSRRFFLLTHRLLRLGNRGLTRIDFLRATSRLLLRYAECDSLEIRLTDGPFSYQWTSSRSSPRDGRLEVEPRSCSNADVPLEQVIGAVRDVSAGLGGSADATSALLEVWTPEGRHITQVADSAFRSMAVLPLFVNDANPGTLILRAKRSSAFHETTMTELSGVALALGLAIANRRAQAALRERIKELTCLYGVARITDHLTASLDDQLQRIVSLLPPAWQFPRIARARIVLDSRVFEAGTLETMHHIQSTPLVVRGRPRGEVVVGYVAERDEFVEGAFLPEERALIDTVAREIAWLVERYEEESERRRLQEQLRHADRLATIGQLAAGVAHELNEPLGNILGFGQLARQAGDLPESTARDLDKIIAAALHGREVIRKLMVFARQSQPKKSAGDLNEIVENGLYFLESRCAKHGIVVERRLASDLPAVHVDASQIHQVLVNLVVNAIQAMPNGGRLIIESAPDPLGACLAVEDTGIGMPPEVLSQIFNPFFTTKDVGEGTGLGLSVVHGIVTSHGGTISVSSRAGVGTRFEIRLPLSPRGEPGGRSS